MDTHNYAVEYVVDMNDEVDVSEGMRKEGDELLIDLVRSRPYLYNKNSKDYRDAEMKSNAWREIASVLECTPSDCQARFLRLRQKFSKKRQMLETETRSGAGKSKKQFLNQHMKQRRTYTNIGARSKISATALYDKAEPSTSHHALSESQEEVEDEDQGNVCAPETQYASSDTTESMLSPRSCSGGVQRKMKRAKMDPVEIAFKQMNETLGTMAGKICSGGGKSSEDDPDVLIGKLVTAELKKADGPRKEKLKREFMRILYADRE